MKKWLIQIRRRPALLCGSTQQMQNKYYHWKVHSFPKLPIVFSKKPNFNLFILKDRLRIVQPQNQISIVPAVVILLSFSFLQIPTNRIDCKILNQMYNCRSYQKGTFFKLSTNCSLLVINRWISKVSCPRIWDLRNPAYTKTN